MQLPCHAVQLGVAPPLSLSPSRATGRILAQLGQLRIICAPHCLPPPSHDRMLLSLSRFYQVLPFCVCESRFRTMRIAIKSARERTR